MVHAPAILFVDAETFFEHLLVIWSYFLVLPLLSIICRELKQCSFVFLLLLKNIFMILLLCGYIVGLAC